ncbi:MAG: hypothetical protein WCG21_10270 [Eubacteriales bacterium]
MKRIRWIASLLFLLFVLLLLCACNNDTSQKSEKSDDSAAETTLWLHLQIEPMIYPTLEKLLDDTDIVIIGTVKETLPVVRLTQSDNDLWKSAVWEEFNVTPSLIQVDEVLWKDAGDITAGDTIRIDQMGGFAGNVKETISYIKYPEVGSSYLMFITFNESGNTDEYLTYEYASEVHGFMQITDGKVYPRAGSQIFESGISVEDVRQALAPEVIPDTMPDDFAVYFAFWINPEQKNFIDTYTGGIQKDLVLNGTQHGEFGSEKGDLEAIYAKMQELSIFDLSGNIISDSVQVTPNEFFLIRYRINGHDYQVSGDGTTGMLDSVESQNLHAFMEYLKNYMINTTDYKAMPAAEGGYD